MVISSGYITGLIHDHTVCCSLSNMSSYHITAVGFLTPRKGVTRTVALAPLAPLAPLVLPRRGVGVDGQDRQQSGRL